MPKRNATSELNHDNWNDEEAPEEAGTFQKASQDIIEKRVIRSAKRRVQGSGSGAASVFAGFQGFSKSSDSSNMFSFLKKGNTEVEKTGLSKTDVEVPGFGTSKPFLLQTSSSENRVSEDDPFQPSPPFTASYLAAIKKLNECFLKHIQTCLSEKQYIILSPCFRDYEKHLKNILHLNDSSNKGEGEKVTDDKSSNTPQEQKKEEHVPSVFDTEKKKTFSDNSSSEATQSTFKIFGGDGNKSPLMSNPASLGSGSLFAAPAQKQFTWTSTWGNSSSPNQKLSEPQKDISKGEGTSSGENVADESEEPPKEEFKQVVEEGAVYSRRCKVFVKKDENYQDHGVGMLYLKPVESGKKTQLIVRADTNLGNLLINTLVVEDMTMQRMGKNNVMLICLPTPDFNPAKPHPVLLRVKTSEDADELLQKLNELKK